MIRRWGRFVFVVILLVVAVAQYGSKAASAASNTLYVAIGGNDIGNCQNPAAPCATIDYAVSQAADQDTIQVGSGTFQATDVLSTNESLFLRGATAGPAPATVVQPDSPGDFVFAASGGGSWSLYDLTINDPSGDPVIANSGGYVGVYDSTVSNSVVAISASGTGALFVQDSTITGNTVGIDATSSVSNFVYSDTVTGNMDGIQENAATFVVAATIISNSSFVNCNATSLTDGGYNLEDGSSCGFSAATSISSTDPQLGPLGDNGGPTETFVPGPTSPALDHVSDSSLCPSTDQRGFSRNIPCDIGAYDGAGSVVAPCTPGTTACSATVTVASQSVAVTGAKAVRASATISLSVAPQVLSCPHFDYLAPVSTLTDTNLSGTDVLVTDTVRQLPSKKGVEVCYQPVEASPPTPVLLKKCHGSRFVAACYKSVAEVSGDVVVQLELPVGDPRFHIGGETPSVTKYSPTSPKPGKTLTIKGVNLSEVTGVTIGGVPAHITKTAPTSVKVTVPAGATGGIVVVSSLAGAARGPSVTVSGARIPRQASSLKRDEPGRR